MDPKALIDHYVKAVSKLASRDDTAPILQLIDAFISKSDDAPYRTLLEGERAFWNEDFQTALKQYLKAKSLPNTKFFCYRASAFLSDRIGDQYQAVDYAKKALSFYPDDPSAKSLIDKLQAPAEELEQILKDYPRSPRLFLGEEPLDPPPLPEPSGTGSSVLAGQIEASLERQQESIEKYLEFINRRESPQGDFLTILNGWDKPSDTYPFKNKPAPTGIFCRLNGYGVVINPGRHFLDRFHEAGFLVTDIHAVIVTQKFPHCSEDLLPLYTLNDQLSEYTPKRHVIHYYLHPVIHREFSPFLKSRHREEKHALQSLDMYDDSTRTEKVPLEAEVALGYFASSPFDSLGITLEAPGIKLGYLAGCTWSPMLALHCKGCDVLCIGVGYASKEDLMQSKTPHDCLGLTGTRSLLESVEPKLLLCTEFSKHIGDHRLEFVHDLRQSNPLSTIFPADLGFHYDLRKGRIRCSISDKLVDMQSVKVTRTQGFFSRLHYHDHHAVL